MSAIIGFFRALGLIWRQRERLLPLLQALPAAIHTAGRGMELAGEGATGAGRLVGGGAGVPINAHDVVAAAAQAVTEGRQRIAGAAAQIRAAGNQIGQVKMPVPSLSVTPTDGPEVVTGVKIEPVFGVEVGFIKVMTGATLEPTTTTLPGIPAMALSVDEQPAFAPVATALDGGADQLDDVATALGTAASNLEQLAQAFEDAGEHLGTAGTHLTDGGQALQEVTEPLVE